MKQTTHAESRVPHPTPPPQPNARDRRTALTGAAANIAMAGVLAVGVAVACAATASADPPPPIPADPASPAPTGYVPPESTIGTGLAQNNDQSTGPAGLPQCMFGAPDESGSGGPTCLGDFLLGQTATPALRGTAPASPLGDGSALNTGYLFPENATMTAQEQSGSMYGFGGPSDDSPPSDQWDAIKRARGLFHTVMGKVPEDQLGGALPGTAPPPGTNLPVGTNW